MGAEFVYRSVGQIPTQMHHQATNAVSHLFVDRTPPKVVSTTSKSGRRKRGAAAREEGTPTAAKAAENQKVVRTREEVTATAAKVAENQKAGPWSGAKRWKSSM